MESLERLQGLHADLVAFTEVRLANIDRLWQELETTLDDFRKLLDVLTPAPAEKEAYDTEGKKLLQYRFPDNLTVCRKALRQ